MISLDNQLANQPQLVLLAEDKIFVDLVCNRITAYGQIPYSVPTRLVIDIIKDSARLFYRTYYRATQSMFYRVDPSAVLDYQKMRMEVGYENIIGYVVGLPSYIGAIKEIYQTNKTNWTLTERILENAQLAQRSSPYGQSIMGINQSLYIIESVCEVIEAQAFSSVLGTTVPFSYSPLTHKLHIKKEIGGTLILDTLANVNIQVLYNDDLFLRHVICKVKQELARIIGGHTIELPGGVTLNVDVICNNLEDAEKVEEYLKASGGIGDLILQRD